MGSDKRKDAYNPDCIESVLVAAMVVDQERQGFTVEDFILYPQEEVESDTFAIKVCSCYQRGGYETKIEHFGSAVFATKGEKRLLVTITNEAPERILVTVSRF